MENKKVVGDHALISPKWSCIGKTLWRISHALKRKWTWMLLDGPRSAVTRQGAAVRMCVEELASLRDNSEKEAETTSFSSPPPPPPTHPLNPSPQPLLTFATLFFSHFTALTLPRPVSPTLSFHLQPIISHPLYHECTHLDFSQSSSWFPAQSCLHRKNRYTGSRSSELWDLAVYYQENNWGRTN